MSSGFMGKKLNIFLLLMIILILLGMLGVSVYSQNTLKIKKSELENTSTLLGSCQQNLSQTSDVLFNTLKSLNSTATDIRKYDALYEQKAGELDAKKTELANIQAELTRVTLQKEVYKRQIDEAYIQIIGLNKTITSLNSQIYSLNREVDRLNTRVSCLRNTADSQELSSCFG